MRFYPCRVRRSSCWSTCPPPVSRRYEGTMRESADCSTQHQRYHVLSAAPLSSGDNRNFVHMKVMVNAGVSFAFAVRETVCGGRLFRSLFKESALKIRIRG